MGLSVTTEEPATIDDVTVLHVPVDDVARCGWNDVSLVELLVQLVLAVAPDCHVIPTPVGVAGTVTGTETVNVTLTDRGLFVTPVAVEATLTVAV